MTTQNGPKNDIEYRSAIACPTALPDCSRSKLQGELLNLTRYPKFGKVAICNARRKLHTIEVKLVSPPNSPLGLSQDTPRSYHGLKEEQQAAAFAQ